MARAFHLKEFREYADKMTERAYQLGLALSIAGSSYFSSFSSHHTNLVVMCAVGAAMAVGARHLNKDDRLFDHSIRNDPQNTPRYLNAASGANKLMFAAGIASGILVHAAISTLDRSVFGRNWPTLDLDLWRDIASSASWNTAATLAASWAVTQGARWQAGRIHRRIGPASSLNS